MILSHCKSCCFLVPDKGCDAGRMCLKEKGNISTPGFCRLRRTSKWKSRHLDGASNEYLMEMAIDELELKFTLIIMFDEKSQSEEDLKKTIESDWTRNHCTETIIADVTGNVDRKNVALSYVRSIEKQHKVKLDLSVERESGPGAPMTVHRMAKFVCGNFFLVLPAGKSLENIEELANHMQNVDSRAIFWHFPLKIGNTSVSETYPHFGLYALKPYKYLHSNVSQPFSAELLSHQDELGISLSWFVDRCQLV